MLIQKIINELDPKTEFLKSYLLGRKIHTRSFDGLSDVAYAPIGIPQGGVLPPLLFSFFLSDINVTEFIGKIILYADDVQLIYSAQPNDVDSLYKNIASDALCLSKYLLSFDMKLNESKTVISRYGSPHLLRFVNPQEEIYLLNCHIPVSDGARNLGLWLDSNLTFRTHFCNVSKKCFEFLYHVKAIWHLLTDTKVELLKNSYVVSKIRSFLILSMAA